MHIAFFSNTYLPVVSGVVRSVDVFRQSLTEMGHNVFVFAPKAHRYDDEPPFIFRYPAFEIGMGYDVQMVFPVSRFVDRLLPALKLDVIHSHHPFMLGETAVHKAQTLDIPMVFTFHTRYREYSHYVGIEQDAVKDITLRWISDYIGKCHHIVVPSDSIKHMLADDYGVTEQVTVVPTGIDLEPYQNVTRQEIRDARGWADAKILICVSRLAKEKNWETLLQAVALVAEKQLAFRLIVVGDGVERQNLERLTLELGIVDRVEFVGKVPFTHIPKYLKAADIFCFASVTETQGLVMMEAMAADLPVVAVDGTGTRDAVEDGVQGLLTANDPAALAQAIEKLLIDETLLNRFKAGAMERVKFFGIKHQSTRLLEVYQQAKVDHKIGRYVPVPKPKAIFRTFMESDAWYKLWGLDENAGGRV